MDEFYGAEQRALQARFETQAMADLHLQTIVHAEVEAADRAFIESRDMFFLASVDAQGQPTCSYKGGAPGFVRVLDGKTVAFPSYDGNGMFLSMGNIRAQAKIGILFIDFETPHRMRLQGRATVALDDPLLASFPGAELMVRVAVAQLFVNCPRYVHRFQRLASSRYVPQTACAAPLAEWKRIDLYQDVVPARDRARVESAGGVIGIEEYMSRLASGNG